MKHDYLLGTPGAVKLYGRVRSLPIYDYHCHLSPEEIYLDREFTDISGMWLSGDHYKWQLMRIAGIDEKYITGDAGGYEKFLAYAEAVEYAAGNPLYHWTQMELSMYFGIETPLSPATAEEIYNRANRVIKERHYSPRKLIAMSDVRYIATTDDPADSLEYHEKLASDAGFAADIAPSFRADNLLLIRHGGYPEYIKRLSAAAGSEISDLASLKKAIAARLDFFVRHGCRFSDVGIPFFPRRGSGCSADMTFAKVLSGADISDGEYLDFLFDMYRFFGWLYREKGIVMQWHIAVQRNINSALFAEKGGDCGGDCIGDPVPGSDIAAMLDAINSDGGLPETVIYSLNPAMNEQLATLAKVFRHVRLGTAWWFNDSKDGITELLHITARNGHLGTFLGMLTDSRSFLSYARHDYFRRILCTVLAGWYENGEFCGDVASLAEKICCGNIRRLIYGK